MARLGALLLALLPSCAFLVGAAVGAGVVHATGEDEVTVYFDASRSAVFDACRAELEDQGSVDLADVDAGRLEGSVEGATVKIWISTVSRDTRKVRVQARRHAGVSPDPDMASAVASGVAERLD